MNKCDKQVYKDKNKLTLDDVIIFLPNPTHVYLYPLSLVHYSRFVLHQYLVSYSSEMIIK
jgi:hypothetical protein